MLRGTLDDFTLPDIFRLLSLAKKTGRLDITRSAGQGKVFFRDGDVYYAESSLSKEPLGQKLRRAGVVTEGQLRKALDQNASSGERVGTILVNSGVVTPEQIQAAVARQIEDAAFDLLRWELGEFSWEPEMTLDVEVPIYVSVENLIMEASRRLDELEIIKRKIPSAESVLMMAQKPPEGAVEINITPEEWQILVLVNGERSVADIAALTGRDEFEAMRMLYGLVSAGLIELSGQHEIARAAAPARLAEEAAPEVEAEAEPEPEPEPEPEAEPEPEPEVEPAFATEPELPVEVEAGTEDELAVAELTEEDLLGPAAEAEPSPATISLEPEAEEAPVDVPAATVEEPREEWFQDPAAVESFDVPAADELVTQTPVPDVPATDPFLDDLLGSEPVGSTSIGDVDVDVPTPPAAPPDLPAPPAEPETVEEAAGTTEPAAESPTVDRASVVRELAGLFSDEDAAPRARNRAARKPAEGGEGEPDTRKRVEDDDQVTKGLISRLIDGVKGL